MIDGLSLVKDYMRREVSTIDVGCSAFEASKTMEAEKVNYLIVLRKGKPVGIITGNDLVLRVMATDADSKNTKISGLMSTPLVSIDPDESIDKAIEVMARNKLKKLPVIKSGCLYGIFTAKDLIQHYEEMERKMIIDAVRLVMY